MRHLCLILNLLKTKSNTVIKVLLAEDHNIVRNGIRSLLEKQSDIEVVAEATNGMEVIQKLEEGLRFQFFEISGKFINFPYRTEYQLHICEKIR